MSGPMYYWKCRTVDCANVVAVPNSLCRDCAEYAADTHDLASGENDRITRWALAGFGPLREYLAKHAAFNDAYPET